MNSITDETLTYLDNLDYLSKERIYKRLFSFGNIPGLDNKIQLISLLALTSNKIKQKNPKITSLDILMKITHQDKDDSGFYQFLETLAIISDDLSYQCTEFNAYGCKSSEEVINKIKEILNTWLPF